MTMRVIRNTSAFHCWMPWACGTVGPCCISVGIRTMTDCRKVSSLVVLQISGGRGLAWLKARDPVQCSYKMSHACWPREAV